jgi:hypothetical protein
MLSARPLAHDVATAPYAVDCSELADLARILETGVQLAVHRREPDVHLVSFLNRAHAGLGQGIREVAEAGKLPRVGGLLERPDSAPLAEELVFLTGLYTDLIGCPAVGLRIEVLDQAMCPRFHVDRVGVRLLCTWRGHGTEWLDDVSVDRRRLGAGSAGLPDDRSGLMLPGAAIRSVPTHAIALLKGAGWPGNEARGVIHRSPAVPAGEGPRILVSLDAVWDR